MQEVIIDFFERFRSDITESIYAVKGIEDYQKLKTFYDYLDYDRQTIYRDNKDTEACGLRNIGNTCYLNVFLQLLYHINFLREKIFSNQNQKSRILEELKYLFGRMQLGKLTYADPANLYEQLKKKHPDVFIDGVQNDFHEIFTILLDQLKESLKETSENDAKMIDKMLFGKLAVRTYHSEGKSLRNTRFNIINLDSSLGGLQKALQNWKRYEIEDYMTYNKKTVKASVQTEFIETPALMTFFINRVSFKDNSLVKDNREFLFQKVMHLSKGTSTPVQCVFSDKPSQKPSLSLKQQQLLLQKSALQSWITKSQSQKITLINTLKYLQQKQFPNINLPQIENKFEQQTTCSKVKEYLQEEIHQIQSKIQDSKKEIIAIDDKLIRIAEQGETQMYHLWGMMIHQGNTATSGHYKVVLNTDQDKWVEFNDRKVYPIDQAKIDTYSKKGQICCLFYRRPTLVCTQKKVALSGALKSKVLQIEKQIMFEVDNARVLQNLYQMSQSSGYLLEHQTKQKNQNRWFYFFKPILHCLQEHYTFSQCQGVLTYENLKQQSNIQKLQNSFLIERQMSVPDLSLQMPSEYFKYSQVFKKFTKKQTSFELVQEAFEWLADNLAIPIKNKTVAKWVQKYLEIFVMKGVFYLCVFFRATVTPLVEAKFTRLFKSIQKIMKKLNVTSDFTLTYIPIKDEVYRMFNTKIKNSLLDGKQLTKILKPTSNQALSKMICQNYCQLFKQRFGYWILEREKLSQIDEGMINSEAELQKQYIVELG